MYLPHINLSNCRIPTAFYLPNFSPHFNFLHLHPQIHSPFPNMTIKVSKSLKSILLYLLYPIHDPVHYKIYPFVYLAFHLRCICTYRSYHFFPNIRHIVIILSLLCISKTLSHSSSLTNILPPSLSVSFLNHHNLYLLPSTPIE